MEESAGVELAGSSKHRKGVKDIHGTVNKARKSGGSEAGWQWDGAGWSRNNASSPTEGCSH